MGNTEFASAFYKMRQFVEEMEHSVQKNNEELELAQSIEEANHPELTLHWPEMTILPIIISLNPDSGQAEVLANDSLVNDIWPEVKDLIGGNIGMVSGLKTLILPTSQIRIKSIEKIVTIVFEILDTNGKTVLMYHPYGKRGDCHLHSFVDTEGIRKVFERLNKKAQRLREKNRANQGISFEVIGPMPFPESFSQARN